MKILGIGASPREESNTEILVRTVLRSAGEVGAQVGLFQLTQQEDFALRWLHVL